MGVVYNETSRLNMRKEILLAIIVGVIVGLGLTFGLYLLRQRLSDSSTARTIEESRGGKTSETQSDEQIATQSLVLQLPEPDTFSETAEIRVVGRAIPNSYIVTLVGPQEFITTADADGDFSKTITLQAGGNRVTVVATSPDGVQETVVRSVVFSNVSLTAPTSNASGSANASSSAASTGGNR